MMQKNVNNKYINCIDYTVSRETFTLVYDKNLELLQTTPQPKDEELSKYYQSKDYISHTDSNQTFFDKIYQIAKNYAINKKVNLIKKLTNYKSKKTKLKLLDLGCGTGDFLMVCKKQNWSVIGVEPNSKAVENLKSKTKNLKLYTKINELKKEKQFDVITMWHVLEHILNLEEYISQLKKLLKTNGTLIIAVPNYKSYDATYYKEFWAAYDVPRHLWHFSQKSIQLLFKKENMNVVKTIPMKLDSFYVSLLSEKNKTGKRNPIKAFYIGLKSNIKAKRTKEYSSLIYVIKNN